jgi:hypothetical protein
MFQGKKWIMGSEFTVVDSYALVFYGWSGGGGFPIKELGAYTAWRERMMKRPTVRKPLPPSRTFRQLSVTQVRLLIHRSCIQATPTTIWAWLLEV